MDLNFIIFPAPSSSYKVDSFKPGELLWIPKNENFESLSHFTGN